MLVLLITFSLEFGLASSKWDEVLNELPKEARQVIETHLKCSSYGVEDFKYPTEENVNEYEINKCRLRFEKNERLREKYKNNVKVVNLLDCADLSISHPDQCPD